MHICMDEIMALMLLLPGIGYVIRLTRMHLKMHTKHPPISVRLKKFSRLLL